MSASETVNTHLHELTALLIELRTRHPGTEPLATAIEGKCWAIADAVRALPCVDPAPVDGEVG